MCLITDLTLHVKSLQVIRVCEQNLMTTDDVASHTTLLITYLSFTIILICTCALKSALGDLDFPQVH